MEEKIKYSPIGLDEDVRYELVKDFVKNKEDMLRQESGVGNGLSNTFFFYKNKKTKAELYVCDFYFVYTLGKNYDAILLRDVLKKQNVFRKEMIKVYGEPYKLALKEKIEESHKADLQIRKQEREKRLKKAEDEDTKIFIKKVYEQEVEKSNLNFHQELIDCGIEEEIQ